MNVLVAVTHLLGAGHLTRAAALARAFGAAGHRVTLVSGGVPAAGARAETFERVQLPPVRVRGTAFGTLLDAAGAPVDAAYLAARRDGLAALARDLRPDVLVTELYPFGRRVLAAEFEALLAAARPRRPLVLASVRDVLAGPSKPARAAATLARLASDYDAVLVHGDPGFLPLEASWPVTPDVPLRYTGYVDEGGDATPLEAARDEIVVSGGSSAAGLPLQAAALAAARLTPDRTWRILVGRAVDADAFDRLASGAPPNARVERARPDFRRLLAACALSVSQAGYNTAVDVMRTGPRALLVPFEDGHETEQRLRAEAMARAGLATVLAERDLGGETLAAAVKAALGRPRPGPARIALEGASRSVEAVEVLLGHLLQRSQLASADRDEAPGRRRSPLPFGRGAGVREGASRAKLDLGAVARDRRDRDDRRRSLTPTSLPLGRGDPRLELRGGDREVGVAAPSAPPRLPASSLQGAGQRAGLVESALDEAAGRGERVVIWWRDDDAVAASPALDRLLALAARFGWPLALAVIPVRAEPSLAARVEGSDVNLLVHGLAHANQAPAGEKRAEFGAHRPLAILVAEAARALALARDGRCEAPWLPVLVPPWNRIAPALAPRLAGLGYRGLSAFGARTTPAPGLVQVNAHLDPVAWHAGRGLRDPGALEAELAAAIRARAGPVGLLTHHLVHDEATWDYLEGLLARLAAHPAVERATAAAIFGAPLWRSPSNDA